MEKDYLIIFSYLENEELCDCQKLLLVLRFNSSTGTAQFVLKNLMEIDYYSKINKDNFDNFDEIKKLVRLKLNIRKMPYPLENLYDLIVEYKTKDIKKLELLKQCYINALAHVAWIINAKNLLISNLFKINKDRDGESKYSINSKGLINYSHELYKREDYLNNLQYPSDDEDEKKYAIKRKESIDFLKTEIKYIDDKIINYDKILLSFLSFKDNHYSNSEVSNNLSESHFSLEIPSLMKKENSYSFYNKFLLIRKKAYELGRYLMSELDKYLGIIKYNVDKNTKKLIKIDEKFKSKIDIFQSKFNNSLQIIKNSLECEAFDRCWNVQRINYADFFETNN